MLSGLIFSLAKNEKVFIGLALLLYVEHCWLSPSEPSFLQDKAHAVSLTDARLCFRLYLAIRSRIFQFIGTVVTLTNTKLLKCLAGGSYLPPKTHLDSACLHLMLMTADVELLLGALRIVIQHHSR